MPQDPKVPLKVSRYVSAITPEPGTQCLFSGLSGALLQVETPLKQIRACVRKNSSPALDARTVQELEKGLFLVPTALDELEFLEQRFQWGRYQADTLGVTILPTYRCNLRCAYCYQSKLTGTMAPPVRRAVVTCISQLLAERRCRNLMVTWFGGEPLLAQKILVSLGRRLKSVCEAAGVAYHSMVVTNGTLLTPASLSDLMAAGVSQMQVTLDGPAHIHNVRRPFRQGTVGGRASYEASLDGILAAAKHMPVSIRANLDRGNAASATVLIEELESRGVLDSKQPHRVSVSWGCTSNFAGIPCRVLCGQAYSVEQFAQVEFDLHADLVRRGHLYAPYPSPNPPVPCGAVDASSFVVDPFGHLYKCWLDVGCEDRSFGQVGSPVDFLDARLRRWLGYNPYRITACRECAALPLCQGGCPALSMRSKDRLTDVCYRWRFRLPQYLQLHAQIATANEPARTKQGRQSRRVTARGRS